jgi:general secretion pathway protein E
VRAGIGLTFASSLRSILRQDPDVVMVGEIRDLETAEIAVQAALTGHLVFSTLHTNDASGAVSRLVDMGAEPYLLSSVLEGVLAQRLLRRICSQCRTPHTPDPAELLALGVGEEARGVELYRGAGCEACRGTGYRGRTGIYELLAINEEIRGMILKRASAGEIRRVAQQTAGLVTLREDGWLKARAGVTTLEEVLSATQDDD